MKKLAYIILSILLMPYVSQAQGLFDVSRYSNTDILGTARYMSMAGSMGAVGGDPSAVIDNPGALGIYRSSELSFTLNATPSVTFANSDNWSTKKNDFFFNFNQLSYILSVNSGREKGYVSSNFAFTYNRLKDFNRKSYIRADNVSSMANYIAGMTNGFAPSALISDNEFAPYMSILGYESYLINPGAGADSIQYSPISQTANQMAYMAVESGRIDEYNFSYAANVGHFLYIGAGIGLQTINYRLSSTNGEYYNGGQRFSLDNIFSTTGIGTVLRVGIIARPVSFMRIGFSFQSPVWYSMNDSYRASAKSEGILERGTVKFETPRAYSEYDFNAPLKFQASLGFVFGKVGLLNVDYQYTHNKGSRLIDKYSEQDIFAEPYFSFENDDIKANALTSHLLKIGAEFRVAQQFSFRAGFAYETKNIASSATRYLMDNTTRTDVQMFHDMGSLYAAGGFGYRYNGFGIDITYAYARHNQEFSPYQSGATLLDNGYFGVPKGEINPKSLANVHTNRHNVVLTLLYKF